MKKTALVILIVLSVFVLISCQSTSSGQNSNDIFDALGENASLYNEIELNGSYEKSQYASVKNVYNKDNNYIIYSVGNFGYNGPVELVILFNEGVIVNLKGINIKETENYGARAFEDSYLSQFINVNVNDIDLLVGGSKPSESVDIIYVTHATRTSTAILAAVNEAIGYYKSYIFTID